MWQNIYIIICLTPCLALHKKILDSTTTIKIGDDTIDTSDSAKNLGVLQDCDLTLSPYITNIS